MSEEIDNWTVLICGSRFYLWPRVIFAVLNRLHARHEDRLVVVEGYARGADATAHAWCLGRRFDDTRHRCYPVDWVAERKALGAKMLWKAGHDRNTRMLASERPRLVVAFHEQFSKERGGTSDMCLKGVLAGVPTWLVPVENPNLGEWVDLEGYPEKRIRQACCELETAGISYSR